MCVCVCLALVIQYVHRSRSHPSPVRLYKIFHIISFGGQKRPENVAQLRAQIVKLCRALSEDLCRKVVTNARVRLQEVVRQNRGHIEHILH